MRSEVGHRTLRVSDAEYPARLRELSSPPDPLFLAGRWVHPGPCVAIVGSRTPTDDGVDVARELAAALCERGVAIVSGLARGIDAAAHEGALDAGGVTGAVLGTPLDETYPRAHLELQHRVAHSMGLMTELPSGRSAARNTFASRNRIVAAIADAVVVVQGRTGSGAVITAEDALRLGRPVAALPWDARDPLGEAPHQLIRGGKAALVRNVDDVMELLGAKAGARSVRGGWREGSAGATPPHLAPHEAALYKALRQRSLPLDQLATAASLTAAELSIALLGLELQGLARRLPGGLVQRTSRVRVAPPRLDR